MELMVTIAYIFLVRLIFFDFKLLKFNVFWGIIIFGLYGAAALTEIILLGQYTPYSKMAYVQAYTIPIAPQIGGMVKQVHVVPNQAVKTGAPLFTMDEKPLQDQVDQVKGQIALQERKYNDYARLRATGAIASESVTFAFDTLQSLKAKLAEKQYNLENATLYAPTDGFVTAALLRPGGFIRLKVPVLSFISTDEYWLIAKIPQKGSQRIKKGDKAEVAFEMYPGKVFNAVVDNVIWATGEAQMLPSGKIPDVGSIKISENFVVKLKVELDNKNYPLRFGANGLLAIYTNKSPEALIFLRQLEIRAESYLNYIYNPFR